MWKTTRGSLSDEGAFVLQEKEPNEKAVDEVSLKKGMYREDAI